MADDRFQAGRRGLRRRDRSGGLRNSYPETYERFQEELRFRLILGDNSYRMD